ncbi:MAG: Trigger factor [Microgenomates group bacterium GW2011_GWC1_49_7]|nr:MAG: Trigger factor [Microgenomates group bacterium GW2011_GWC1_49_7]
MTSTINRLSDGTIELTITIPWTDVAKTYEDAVVHMVSEAELPGFRKGKAPRDLVEKSLDKTKVYEEALKTFIPKSYNDAITQQKVKPIVNPKIELKDATENKDWVFRALTAERPTVTLGEYKKAIQELKASKTQKIWKPGDLPDRQAGKPEEKDKETKPTLDEVLMALYKNVMTTLPAILVEHEVNRLLSELIDQTKKLGLTVEQYLASTQRTSEGIKKEYEEQAKRTLTLEFALEAIADVEGILVSDDDIDAVIKTGKTDEEKEALKAQRYYLASVLRRQKTLDFLASL